MKSANVLGLLLSTAGFQVCIGTIEAGEIEIFSSGELKSGLVTAADEQLSNGEGDRGYALITESKLYIKADISPSDNLEIGAEVVLETDVEFGEVNVAETYIFVEGAFGLMQLGRTEGAEDEMALGAATIAAGTGGIDGDTENLGEVEIVGSKNAAKISYFTPRLFGVQAGLSITPDTGDNEGDVNDIEEDGELQDLEDHIGLGLNVVGKLGDLKAGLAVVGSYGNAEDPARNDLDAFAVGGTLAIDDVEFGASYGKNNAAEDFEFGTAGVTVGISEATAGVGYNYLDQKADGITHVIVLSGDVLLLEGVELQADVSYADPEDQRTNLASVLAIEFSF